MPRFRIALAVAIAGVAFAPARSSAESMPPFWNSTVPGCISLVGSNGATASATGTFVVVVRDLANNPVPGVLVTVDLGNAPDLHLCALQPAPGIIMDCTADHASVITDVAGRAMFTLLGSGVAAPTGSGLNNGRIYADGNLIASPTVSAFDLDGANGVGANDFSLWLNDFYTGLPLGRSDYDCSGSIGANDLSVWLTEFGSSASSISCAATCP